MSRCKKSSQKTRDKKKHTASRANNPSLCIVTSEKCEGTTVDLFTRISNLEHSKKDAVLEDFIFRFQKSLHMCVKDGTAPLIIYTNKRRGVSSEDMIEIKKWLINTEFRRRFSVAILAKEDAENPELNIAVKLGSNLVMTKEHNGKVIVYEANKSLEELTTELLEMSTSCSHHIHEQNRVVYLGENKKRVQEIGEFLKSMGGFKLMKAVAEDMPLHDQRELDYAWNGIGEWRC